jgi:serine/threonine-protein kinase
VGFPGAERAGEAPYVNAIDAADALLVALVARQAAGLTLAPQGQEYEAALIRVASPEPLLRVPLPLGHAVAVRLGLIAGLDPWARGDRFGQIDLRVGRSRGEFVVILRDTAVGFSVELRRLVAQAGASATSVSIEDGRGQIGPYRIEGELGRGSMGIVYRASRDGLATPVAIKLLNPAIAADPGMAARFVREGRAAALANDPGVVGVSDFGTLPDGRAFLVMELVEGRTLEAVLAERGAFAPIEALRVTLRIVAALEAAHVRGVIHRDLKPSNIFLTSDGQIKIADFGAALVQDVTRGLGGVEDSVVLGTPAYMAPEQAQAQPTDDRADIYSLGCILFRMLSGAPPFRGSAVAEVLLKHVSEPPPPVTSAAGPLPEVLVGGVARALAKRPEDRFRSVGEMRVVLEYALGLLGGRR